MNPKILLVDDRDDNLMSIEAILMPDNYTLVKANSGRQALKILLQEYDFALILMDVNMPNLNGFETASLIYEREKLKHIPIIFITAHNYGEENIFRGYRSGAVDYIYKPINPELLRAKVSVFIELYRKNHKLLAQEQKLMAINKSLENEISERKVNEEKIKGLNLELLKNIDRLEAANKNLDRFAFMASHDLQEPLRKIRVFSECLATEFSAAIGEGGQRYIQRIDHAADRMQNLIKDILTFSKITAENDKNAFVPCDLNGIVKDVLTQLDDSIKSKSAEVTVDMLPSLVVNPGLMQPLFHNLLSNSLKYTRKGVAPVVKIFCESTTSTMANGLNGYCRIFVEDNGIGFDQKHAETIFGMFKRLHHNSEYEGTGIGLALCKRIVEEHNGYISARGQENGGATFIVSLPLNASSAQPETAQLSMTETE